MSYIFISEWIIKFKKMNKYENRFENIYVISNHPDNEEEIIFKEKELNELIINVDYVEVIKQIGKEKDWLVKSENNFYNGEMSEKNRLQVIPIIFRDGKYVNENWKSFKARAKAQILESREERHEILKSANNMYYQKYMNFQKDI
ncbi:MAG: hypothetical protein Unbinned5350contig1001_14 [Prokaryotic dsDNA virus sp.]|nr:MAG: hypothetical protein Unbinned5350contig1001_14 [Prokaryotic dsDNA virus sp.]